LKLIDLGILREVPDYVIKITVFQPKLVESLPYPCCIYFIHQQK
jgi:hypothetical protein